MRKSFFSAATMLLVLTTLSACNDPVEKPVVKPPMPSDINPPVVVDAKVGIEKIISIVDSSKCASYSWKNRGKAPAGYMRGMALTYARSICNPSPTVSNTKNGSSDKDALAYYGTPASSISTYTLLIGLGMRESSGTHCVGRDTTATNTKAETAEAGLFQTSYNSSSSNPELPLLLKNFDKKCYLEYFSEKVSCSKADWSYFGSGLGYDFQVKAKTCPSFAAEYAAITLRSLRKHYGPINRNEAEFKLECSDMLTEVKLIVEADKENICAVL